MGKKLSYDEVKKYVESFGNILLSKEYINNKSDLLIKCKCGRNEFKRSLASMKQHKSYYCSDCINELISIKAKSRMCLKDVIKEYNDVVEYVKSKNCKFLSDTYRRACDIYKFQCECGNTFERKFNKFKNANQIRCHKCSLESTKNKLKYNYNFVKNKIEENGNILLSKEYINNSINLKIQCKCGNIFYRNFDRFVNEELYYCKSCSDINSKGEEYINILLKNTTYDYESQYRFDNCKNNKPLPFDFYIPNKNILIEYDGKQHYIYGCFGRNLLDLMNLKRNDKIKTKYCLDNNIQLIRIPYWEFNNIEQILI